MKLEAIILIQAGFRMVLAKGEKERRRKEVRLFSLWFFFHLSYWCILQMLQYVWLRFDFIGKFV